MKLQTLSKMLFLVAAILVAGNSSAAETGTFTYLYSESFQIDWPLAVAIAVAIGLFTFLTAGTTAPPAIAYIGTLIGSAHGLGGVAATNYGLALLGGGAIASGGMGMAGGIAFLSSVLAFSTQVVQDFAVSKIGQKYSYSQLAEESKNLPTLPPFLHAKGHSSYVNAFEKVKTYNKQEANSSNFNQSVLREVIQIAKKDFPKVQGEDQVQLGSLLSYAYFATNQFQEAAQQSRETIKVAREMNARVTLPAYIYSVSTLYNPKPDFSVINDEYFRYSVVAEPDNDLIPFMFSIYLSHINLRYRGETSWYYQEVSKVARDNRIREYSDQILPVILVNYFVNLKVEQQRIMALTGTASKTIKDSPITVADTEKALREYKSLLWGARVGLDRYKIKPELSASEKLIVDAQSKLEKAQAALSKSAQANLSRSEVIAAQNEAGRLFRESQASLVKAQLAVSKSVSNSADAKKFQVLKNDMSGLFEATASRMESTSNYLRNYFLNDQTSKFSQEKASELVEEAKKSVSETHDQIKKMLNKEQLKRKQIIAFEKLLTAYDGDYKRLSGLVASLKSYQASQTKKKYAFDWVPEKIPGYR